MNEEQIEREQVEQVFALTGGELDDKPWEPWVVDDDHAEQVTFRYHYDGPPEYATSDFDRDEDYVTVVSCILYGEEPEVLHERGYRYERVIHYMSSGECECPFADINDVPEVDERPCPLCEAQEGEEHGHIYLGDGWAETVYRVVRVCKECGGDLTSREDLDDEDRCLACCPYDLRVIAEGAGAHDGGSDVVYEGSDADAAMRAFTTWAPRCDVTLKLDSEAVRVNSGFTRYQDIRKKARDLWAFADYHDSTWFWDNIRDYVAATRRPWDDHDAEAYVRAQWDLRTGGGPDSWIEYRMYYRGERVESRSSLIGAGKVPPGDWSKVIGVHVWKRTGVVWHWGDEARQAEIAGINDDFAAQYAKWSKECHTRYREAQMSGK